MNMNENNVKRDRERARELVNISKNQNKQKSHINKE